MKKLIVILLFLGVNASAQERFYPQALIELYSSEGCENCPYADAFMKEIMHIADSVHQPVYVIDFHVDIWDRSGWKDPFSNAAFSKRQFMSATKAGQQAIFTPMVFVNGQGGIPGSAKKEIGYYINAALGSPRKHKLVADARQYQGKNTLTINYQITGQLDSTEIHFALVRKEIKQNVTAGDNKGKILEHHNVVIRFETDVVKSAAGSHELELPGSNMDMKEYALVVFLQKQDGGNVYAVDELLFR